MLGGGQLLSKAHWSVFSRLSCNHLRSAPAFVMCSHLNRPQSVSLRLCRIQNPYRLGTQPQAQPLGSLLGRRGNLDRYAGVKLVVRQPGLHIRRDTNFRKRHDLLERLQMMMLY